MLLLIFVTVLILFFVGFVFVVVSANGNCLYVGTIGSGVLIIDIGMNQFTVIILIASGADSIALVLHNLFGYVVNIFESGDIGVFNSVSHSVSGFFATGGGNVQVVVVSLDGNRLYVIDSNLDQVVVFNSVNSEIIMWISLPMGSNLIGISLMFDGTKVYVANNVSGIVLVIDIDTNTVRMIVSVVGFLYAKG